MRSKLLIVLMVGLVLNLGAFNILAQEEKPKSQLFIIHEDVVKPSMVSEYEAATKEFVAKLAEHQMTGSSYYYTAFVDNDFHYYYVTPVENLAAIDNMEKDWNEFVKKVGEENWTAMLQKFAAPLESHKVWMTRLMPELSYVPENPRLKSEEMPFYHWDFYYAKSGMAKTGEDIAKEWKAVYESNNIADGFNVYRGDIGADLNLFIVAQRGNNPADYYSQQAKIMEMLGEPGKELAARTMEGVRKFESKTGWLRPDLSYWPKEEVTAK
ncbi:MAG: hypothetical protein ACE5NG_06195 [bacterium]